MWRVIGHDHVLKLLEAAHTNGRLSHAYLVSGPPHSGKLTLALDLACLANCVAESGRPCGKCVQCQRVLAGQHADVLTIGVPKEASRKEIPIGAVREVEHQAHLMPFEGRCRVFIVEEADRMSEEAANALLKTLEEPPAHVMFVLTASQEEMLLPTVRSRCQRLELRCLPYDKLAEALVKKHGVNAEEAGLLARLARGCPGLAVQFATKPKLREERGESLEKLARLSEAGLAERFQYAGNLASTFSRDRQQAREELHLWLGWWRDILLVGEGAPEYVQNADRLELLKGQAHSCSASQAAGSIRTLLSTLDALDANANPRLALESMMMALSPERERHG